MARIPKAQGAGLVNTNVRKMETQSIQSAMQPHLANAQAARSIEATAQNLTNVLMDEEKKAYGKKAQADYLLKADEVYSRMTTDDRYKNDLSSFEKDYDKELKNLRKSLVKDAPYDFVKNSTDGMLVNSELNFRRQGASFARNQRVQNTINMQNENTNKLATHFTNNFNYENANEFINAKAESISAYQNTNLYSPDQSKELTNKAIDKYFSSIVDYYEARPERIGELKDILTYNHPKSGQIIEGVKSERIGDQLKRIERIEGQNTSISKSKVNGRLSDIQTSIMSGEFLPPETFMEVANNVDPSWDNANEVTDNIVHLGIINKKLNDYAEGTAEEKAAIINSGFELAPNIDPSFNATARTKMMDLYKNGLAKIYKDVQSNGAEYAMRGRKDLELASMTVTDLSPEVDINTYKNNVQDWIRTSLPLQNEKGVTNPRVVTTDQAKQLVKMIHDGKPETAGLMIERLSQGFDKYSDSLMTELVQHGGLKREYIPAFILGDQEAKSQYLQNLKNKDNIVKLKSTSPHKDNLDLDSFKSNSILTDFVSAINVTNKEGKNLAISTSIAEGAQIEYERQVLSGVSHDTAMKSSLDKFISKNFDVISDGQGIVIPKKYNVNKEKVSKFTRRSLNTSMFFGEKSKNAYLYGMDIDVPEKQKQMISEDPKRSKSITDLYVNHVRENGIWLWDGSDGAVLYEKIVGTDNYAIVKNKMGQQIKMKYKDMETFNPYQAQSTIAGNK